MKMLLILGKNFQKIALVCYFTRKLELVPNILRQIVDKSLKQQSTVPRIFLKILEANLNSSKICESKKYVKGCFALSRLLVTDFLLFNVLFQSSVKMFKVPGFQVLGSWVLDPGVPGPVSRVPSSGFPRSGSWILGSLILGPGCWGPGSRILYPES